MPMSSCACLFNENTLEQMTVIRLKTETQCLLYKQSPRFSIKKKKQNTIRVLSEMSQILNGLDGFDNTSIKFRFFYRKRFILLSTADRKTLGFFLFVFLNKDDKWMSFTKKNTIILNSGKMANKLLCEEN